MDDPVEPRRRLFRPDRLRRLRGRRRGRRRQLGEAGRPACACRRARRRRDEGRARRGLRAGRRRGSARRRRPAPPACGSRFALGFRGADARRRLRHRRRRHRLRAHGALPRRRRLRALRQERPRRPDDPQRARGLVLRAARAVLRRPAGLRRQGPRGQGQRRRHRQAGRGRRAHRPRPDDPQLPAFLALQGAGHLPQHARSGSSRSTSRSTTAWTPMGAASASGR